MLEQQQKVERTCRNVTCWYIINKQIDLENVLRRKNVIFFIEKCSYREFFFAKFVTEKHTHCESSSIVTEEQ